MICQSRPTRDEALRLQGLLQMRSDILRLVDTTETRNYLLRRVESELDEFRAEYGRRTHASVPSEEALLR